MLETAVFQVKKRMEAEKQEAEDRLAGGMPKPSETGAAVPEKGVVEKESDLILELVTCSNYHVWALTGREPRHSSIQEQARLHTGCRLITQMIKTDEK